MRYRIVPDFENEAQEARWWDTHQAETAKELERAAAEGRLKCGSTARKETHLPLTKLTKPNKPQEP
ncbi:MAG: hypothetical protein ABI383_03110 [Acidobacteriaceae bacterium]